MASVASFSFNPFAENTYVVYDTSGECVIIDPGCFYEREEEQLKKFIEENNLRPVRLLNTHCHIDHIFGNKFVAETYGLELEIHEGELVVLKTAPQVSQMFGVHYPKHSPMPGRFIEEGEQITFGETVLETLFTPGHSPASISFYCKKDRFVIAGDVLFLGSIGRTDLPGGDHATLIESIKEQILPLGDGVGVYPGHGPATSVGYERDHNPFLQ